MRVLLTVPLTLVRSCSSTEPQTSAEAEAIDGGARVGVLLTVPLTPVSSSSSTEPHTVAKTGVIDGGARVRVLKKKEVLSKPRAAGAWP